MAQTPERQHYRIACGHGLDSAPPGGKHSGYAKGGKAKMASKKGGSTPRRTSGRGR